MPPFSTLYSPDCVEQEFSKRRQESCQKVVYLADVLSFGQCHYLGQQASERGGLCRLRGLSSRMSQEGACYIA